MAQSLSPINLSIGNQKKILSLLSEKEIKKLTMKHQTDTFNPQLQAMKVLKLYLATFLTGLQPTLRGICQQSQQLSMQMLSGLDPVKPTTLSKRNRKLSFIFFQDVFETLRQKIKAKVFEQNPVLRETQQLQIFDSTFIELSMKLFPWAVHKKQAHKSVFKIGLRLQDQGDIPEQVLVQTESTDENTLFESFIDFSKKAVTYLFDRGFYVIEVLFKIIESENFFITRAHPQYKITPLETLRSELTKNNKDFWFVKEQAVLIGARGNQMPHPLRYMTVRIRKGNQIFHLLTNREDLTAEEVAQLYLKRWQIEPFFKWLKQTLKINRLISRSVNGVMIQIYVTLILQLLFALFKETSKQTFAYRRECLRKMQNQFQDHLLWSFFQLGQSLARDGCLLKQISDLKHYVKKHLVDGAH